VILPQPRSLAVFMESRLAITTTYPRVQVQVGAPVAGGFIPPLLRECRAGEAYGYGKRQFSHERSRKWYGESQTAYEQNCMSGLKSIRAVYEQTWLETSTSFQQGRRLSGLSVRSRKKDGLLWDFREEMKVSG